MATKYRIISDGIRFKIQWFGRNWWHAKLKWRVLGRNHPDLGWVAITEYSLEEAKKTLRNVKTEDKAREQGYKVVAE